MSTLKERTMERMNLLGAAPKRSMGQNFLIAEDIVDKIVAGVEKLPSERIIEIGPGLGALTDRLRNLERPLRLVELDRRFAEFWRNEGLDVIEADALDIDWGKEIQTPTVIVSNLPYQISSRIVVDLSLVEGPVKGLVFMFQKEVADRILSAPRSKEYGLLSVIGQTYWDVSALCKVGPHAFTPAPQIGSRVLTFKSKTSEVGKESRFLDFVKAAFSQRRKYLIKNLSGFEPKDWKAQLEKLGKKPESRAEELTPKEFERLYLSSR